MDTCLTDEEPLMTSKADNESVTTEKGAGHASGGSGDGSGQQSEGKRCVNT